MNVRSRDDISTLETVMFRQKTSHCSIPLEYSWLLKDDFGILHFIFMVLVIIHIGYDNILLSKVIGKIQEHGIITIPPPPTHTHKWSDDQTFCEKTKPKVSTPKLLVIVLHCTMCTQ